MLGGRGWVGDVGEVGAGQAILWLPLTPSHLHSTTLVYLFYTLGLCVMKRFAFKEAISCFNKTNLKITAISQESFWKFLRGELDTLGKLMGY